VEGIMFNEVKTYCNEINDILQELDNYESYKEKLGKDLSNLEKRYQKGEFDYKRYAALKNKILNGRTKDALVTYYNAYILTLLKKIDFVNTQIFSEVYGREKLEAMSMEISEATAPKRKKAVELVEPVHEKIPEHKEISEELIPKIKLGKRKEKLIKIPFFSKKEVIKEMVPEPEIAPKLAAKKERVLKPKVEEILETSKIEVPRPLQKRKLKVPKPTKSRFPFLGKTKKSLFEEIREREKIKPEKVKFEGLLNLDIIKNIRKRVRERTKFIGEKTEISPTILKLRKKAEAELTAETPTLMAMQAEKLRNILLKKEVKIYTPSSFGFLANITVRKTVLTLMEHFPDFFKQLYLNLRYANIKILSNTYVNIMFFVSILTFLVSFPLSLIFFSIQKTPFFIDFTKALLFSLILTSLCLLSFI